MMTDVQEQANLSSGSAGRALVSSLQVPQTALIL